MRIILTLLLLTFMISTSKAQKLPDVQSENFPAPAGIRIDGKLLEWNNIFSAENKRTELYYTLANDEKNIYLALKSTSQNAITKIMLGGISLTFNTKGKKKEEDSFTITYPLVARNTANRGGGQSRQRGMQGRNEQSQEQKDSTNLVQRKTQLAGIKEIKVLGFKNITDSLISVYNEYGIKAVATIDEQGAYCYEVAIPLNMLDLPAGFSKELAYRIRLNGRSFGNFTARNNGNNSFGGGSRSASFGGANSNSQQDLFSATDFWGKYSFKK